jgi:hypothetical protein
VAYAADAASSTSSASSASSTLPSAPVPAFPGVRVPMVAVGQVGGGGALSVADPAASRGAHPSSGTGGGSGAEPARFRPEVSTARPSLVGVGGGAMSTAAARDDDGGGGGRASFPTSALSLDYSSARMTAPAAAAGPVAALPRGRRAVGAPPSDSLSGGGGGGGGGAGGTPQEPVVRGTAPRASSRPRRHAAVLGSSSAVVEGDQ